MPVWYEDIYRRAFEALEPARAAMISIPLTVYAYGLIGLLFFLALYIRYRSMNVPTQGKRKRNRQKKSRGGLCWKKKAAKESTISIDPFLADMAYNQKLSNGK